MTGTVSRIQRSGASSARTQRNTTLAGPVVGSVNVGIEGCLFSKTSLAIGTGVSSS